jgi:hypothetical protein
MAVLSFVGMISSAFLPETLKQTLPETIEDANQFGKGNKFWSLHPRKPNQIPNKSGQGSLEGLDDHDTKDSSKTAVNHVNVT